MNLWRAQWVLMKTLEVKDLVSVHTNFGFSPLFHPRIFFRLVGQEFSIARRSWMGGLVWMMGRAEAVWHSLHINIEFGADSWFFTARPPHRNSTRVDFTYSVGQGQSCMVVGVIIAGAWTVWMETLVGYFFCIEQWVPIPALLELEQGKTHGSYGCAVRCVV